LSILPSRVQTDLSAATSTLAESIRQRGLLQPVAVWPDHALTCGERRLLAARQLGWTEIAVEVLAGEDESRSGTYA
jgi:ParB family chromosome partitioning protein